MVTKAAVGKVAKTSCLLMLLVLMTVVPLFVYSTLPRASAWFTSSETSTATTTFSGEAIGAVIAAPIGGRMTFADTGPLPPNGGVIHASLVSPTLPLGTASMFDAVTMGFDSTATSHATTDLVSLVNIPGFEGFSLSADFVMANSMATCTAGVASVSGSSEITALVINGQSISGPFPPNTPGPVIAGVTITLNEQVTTSNSITVNAIHITAGGFDIIISSAESDVICAAAPCPHVEHDFVTGGGWIQRSDSKGTFGFVAGFKGDSSTPSGHLTYIDHSTGTKVQSIDVLTYTLDASNQRTFGGDTNLNGASGYTYSATVQDNGEPGAGHDTFTITVFDSHSLPVYTAAGTLGGGNIEIHN